MSADIILLPGRGPTSPVAHYVRVGEQAHVQLEELHSQGRLAKARGGRRLLVCGDRDCCSGLDDMINNWRGHFLKQRFEQIQRIENVPDLKREDDFLNRDLALADQQSRQIMQLNPVD
jgi:hypothetical protein